MSYQHNKFYHYQMYSVSCIVKLATDAVNLTTPFSLYTLSLVYASSVEDKGIKLLQNMTNLTDIINSVETTSIGRLAGRLYSTEFFFSEATLTALKQGTEENITLSIN